MSTRLVARFQQPFLKLLTPQQVGSVAVFNQVQQPDSPIEMVDKACFPCASPASTHNLTKMARLLLLSIAVRLSTIPPVNRLKRSR